MNIELLLEPGLFDEVELVARYKGTGGLLSTVSLILRNKMFRLTVEGDNLRCVYTEQLDKVISAFNTVKDMNSIDDVRVYLGSIR